ncbi:hypothetical protein FKM82_021966 [Ascaphus truei]
MLLLLAVHRKSIPTCLYCLYFILKHKHTKPRPPPMPHCPLWKEHTLLGDKSQFHVICHHITRAWQGVEARKSDEPQNPQHMVLNNTL